MHVVEARGRPYEIGLTIGMRERDLVRAAVQLVCRFEGSRVEVEDRLGVVERLLERTFPAVLDEASGLAAGAGIDEREALALSVASDLHGRLPGWCSLVAVPSQDGTLLAKNVDTTPTLGPVQIVEVIRPDEGYSFAHVTTAGAMWTDGGVNSAGLALVNASLAAAAPVEDGVPDGILAREVLRRCESVAEGVEFLSGHDPLSLGENLLLADEGGDVAVVEKLPGGQAVRRGPRTVACNHVLSGSLAPLMASSDSIGENSRRRIEHLTTRTAEGESWSLEGVQALLATHDGGICQHGDSELWTVASIVLRPGDRGVWVNDGPPCRAAWEKVRWGIGRALEAARTTEEE